MHDHMPHALRWLVLRKDQGCKQVLQLQGSLPPVHCVSYAARYYVYYSRRSGTGVQHGAVVLRTKHVTLIHRLKEVSAPCLYMHPASRSETDAFSPTSMRPLTCAPDPFRRAPCVRLPLPFTLPSSWPTHALSARHRLISMLQGMDNANKSTTKQVHVGRTASSKQHVFR